MEILLLFIVGIVFSAFAAIVFVVLTFVLGKFFDAFDVSGDGTFLEFYLRYLVIALVYTFVTLPLGNGLIGIAAMAVAYKYVFYAGWTQALVMGTIGGIIALVLFAILVTLILAPMGILR